MTDQEEIHKQCLSKDPKECFKTVEQLKDNFSLLPDKVLSGKQLFWNKLIRTINDKYWNVREKKVWNDLIKLTNDESSDVRFRAAEALGSAFFHVPDKQKAWNDLIKLTSYKKSDVRFRAAEALSSVFHDVPDKQKAWNDLHELIYDEDSSVRSRAAEALGSTFSYVPEKQQAWNDLIRLTSSEDSAVRASANHSLGKFPYSRLLRQKEKRITKGNWRQQLLFLKKQRRNQAGIIYLNFVFLFIVHSIQ